MTAKVSPFLSCSPLSLLLLFLFSAVSTFRQQNVIALIGGSHSKASACALSTVTGIPLVRLHGDNRQLGQCEKAVDMSAEYRYLAHATLDILNKFKWKKISLIFDGNDSTVTESGHQN